jgi:hypothetical protein
MQQVDAQALARSLKTISTALDRFVGAQAQNLKDPKPLARRRLHSLVVQTLYLSVAQRSMLRQAYLINDASI